MTDRGHESPMDFQWDGTGPGDPNSPFRMATMTTFTNGEKRTQSFFQSSPIKGPSFSPPPSTPFLFSTPYQTPRLPPPQPIFRTQSFTTPRHTSNDSDIFSDGTPRTPHTPEVDSEAPTPVTARSEVKGAGTKAVVLASLTPSRTTGRGELRRGLFHDDILNKARRRLPQQLSRDFNMSSAGASGDEAEEPEEQEDPSYSNSEQDSPIAAHPPRTSWRRTAKSAATHWVATHRELPLIASRYLQFFFNLSLLLLLLYALFCFYLTIRRDVDQKIEEYSDAIAAEMNACARSYIENRCAPDMRVPAMESRCSAWEKCMNRDPSQVGRARVSAETFAEIINSFIEPISYKTMIFCLLLVFGGLFISNAAFGFYRAKAVQHEVPYMSHPEPYGVPDTPRWERQAREQLLYESLPRSPAPSTPVRIGYQKTPGRTGGRDRMTGRKETVWR